MKRLLSLTLLTALATLASAVAGQNETRAQGMGNESPSPNIMAQQTAAKPAAGEEKVNPLLSPHSPEMTQKGPEKFKARFETTKGVIVIEVTRSWSPNGADRFYNLVRNGFYDGCRFFRVVSGFMAQFGINGDPRVQSFWRSATIPDDPTKASNLRGYVTFARTGEPNSRTTQLFINFKNNSSLDSQGFSPFGQVVEGMDVVDSLYAEYGEGPPRGAGPNQSRIQTEGNSYLQKSFAKLDYIKKTSIAK